MESIADVIALADIVVLPSYREGTPRVLLEAGAMGKPMIATDVPGCREVVQDGHNGILVPVQDPKALASAAISLLDNPTEARRMGRNGRILVETEFCADQVVQRTLNVYSELGITA